MEHSNGIAKNLIIVFIVFSSLITFVLCATDFNRPEGMELLFLLPLAFFIGFVVLYQKRQMFNACVRTKTGIIVLLVYYIRMVATPLTMYLGSYKSNLETLYSDNYSFAVIMICIECFVVFLYLPTIIHRRLSSICVQESEYRIRRMNEIYQNKPSQLIWLIVMAMVICIIYFIRMDSTIMRHTFLFLIDANKEYTALSNTQSGIGSLSMYVEIISMLFKVLQVILPPMILWHVLHFKIPDRIKYTVSFIIFSSVAIVATEDRIDALFAAFALLYTMQIAFGNRFKQRFKTWMLFMAIIAIIGLSIKSGVFNNNSEGGLDFSSVSSMLQAYFSGIPTVAAGVSMVHNVEGINLLHFPIDVINRVPFLGYTIKLLTGITLSDSNQIFNVYLSLKIGKNIGQILPTTAVGYEYFFVLFPLSACLAIKLATEFEYRANLQTDIIRLNLFHWITICVAGSTVVASSLLIVAKLSWFLFMWMLLWLFDKRRRRT